MRQYLYMSFFARLYSRAPDSPLDQIHDILLKAKTVTPGVFPIDEIGELMAHREKKGGFQFRDEYLWDLDLVLNIIDGGVTEIPEKRGWSLERDHIFPRHQLCQLGIGKDVNDIGNLRLLGKSRNISKSDKMPDANTEFFGKDDLELPESLPGGVFWSHADNLQRVRRQATRTDSQASRDFPWIPGSLRAKLAMPCGNCSPRPNCERFSSRTRASFWSSSRCGT